MQLGIHGIQGNEYIKFNSRRAPLKYTTIIKRIVKIRTLGLKQVLNADYISK